VTLGFQAGLGRLFPDVHRYVDGMMVPVIWYGIAGSQRSAMWVGCAAGLLQDGWLASGTVGLNGFKKTLIGFTLGGLGSRFDLNNQAGRLAGGALASLVDSLMDPLLRRLLDQRLEFPGPQEIVIKALATGLLVVISFGVIDRFRRRRRLRRAG